MATAKKKVSMGGVNSKIQFELNHPPTSQWFKLQEQFKKQQITLEPFTANIHKDQHNQMGMIQQCERFIQLLIQHTSERTPPDVLRWQEILPDLSRQKREILPTKESDSATYKEFKPFVIFVARMVITNPSVFGKDFTPMGNTGTIDETNISQLWLATQYRYGSNWQLYVQNIEWDRIQKKTQKPLSVLQSLASTSHLAPIPTK
ncbi:hypothetical protein SEMRO_3292_G346260.1 [Seminavis robusta]|uniref:Uncharacterized protein n=1 Tax=Seminavis robusta TaxID=568900 RepID=A0A9N8F5D8_9STRA|nr:hypothetical protein SEMRO_3292_G346260.1 [Seminavis robusta]|eukprot:Sro3292_g346260.1 n/a (204) ;mRNA; f:1981-2592